jgi:rRNA maturation protein Nop10
MAAHIMKCPSCEKYTMKKKCCVDTVFPRPPKFSLNDKYADYRRKSKLV